MVGVGPTICDVFFSMPRNTFFIPDFNEGIFRSVHDLCSLEGMTFQPLSFHSLGWCPALGRSFGSLDIIARGGMVWKKNGPTKKSHCYHQALPEMIHQNEIVRVWWQKVRWEWCSMSPKEFKKNTLHLRYSCPLLVFVVPWKKAVSKAKMVALKRWLESGWCQAKTLVDKWSAHSQARGPKQTKFVAPGKMVERSVVLKMFRRTCLVSVMIAKGESLFCIYFSRWRLLELVQFPFPSWFSGESYTDCSNSVARVSLYGMLVGDSFLCYGSIRQRPARRVRNAQFAALHVPRCFKKTPPMYGPLEEYHQMINDFAWPFSSFQAIQPRTSTEGLSLQDAKRLLQVLPAVVLSQHGDFRDFELGKKTTLPCFRSPRAGRWISMIHQDVVPMDVTVGGRIGPWSD